MTDGLDARRFETLHGEAGTGLEELGVCSSYQRWADECGSIDALRVGLCGPRAEVPWDGVALSVRHSMGRFFAGVLVPRLIDPGSGTSRFPPGRHRVTPGCRAAYNTEISNTIIYLESYLSWY